MYRSILVPLDGSQFGEHALPFARAIARQASAALHLAHVHTIAVPISVDAIPVFDEALDAQDRAREQIYLDDLAQRIAIGGQAGITTALLDEPIGIALQNYAATHQIDLVVMTTHGRGALSRFWLGSIADALVRYASMPVLLVHPQEQPPDLERLVAIKRMVLPLDGSALAESMLAPATALGALMGAEFTLLHAVTPEFTSYGVQWPVAQLDAQSMAQEQAAAQGYLDRIAERLGAQSLVAHTATIVGHPAPAIIEYAHDHSADLIALATHGRSGVVRLLLGSVADKILRGASTPVLLYRPPEQA